ncbi:hypothetical protein K435DRAFT_851558 [Dendrothele bispora CBS 962.96]|nr:hypothetical protein K435DRAFT_851558 [Dendrothele bispora CBS 962.96]
MELVGEAQLAPIPTGEITTAWDKDLKAAEDLAEELLKDQLARQGRVLRCEPGAGLQIRSPPPDL